MTTLTLAFVMFVAIAGTYTFALCRNWVSVVFFCLLIAGSYAAAVSLLSRPLPLWMALTLPQKVRLVAAIPIEKKAIYVWVTIPGSREPRAYVVPWSESAATQLQHARKGAGKRGAVVMERGHTYGEPKFYPKPQQPLPPKYGEGRE